MFRTDHGSDVTMWSLLDLAPLAAVLFASVLSAAVLISMVGSALLPDPRPNLRLIHGGQDDVEPAPGRQLHIV